MLPLEQVTQHRRLVLVACVLMITASFLLLAGTTHAWFTDRITNEGNSIKAAEQFASANIVLSELPEASDLPGPLEGELDEEAPEVVPPQVEIPAEGETPPPAESEQLESSGEVPPANESTSNPDAAESPPAASG